MKISFKKQLAIVFVAFLSSACTATAETPTAIATAETPTAIATAETPTAIATAEKTNPPFIIHTKTSHIPLDVEVAITKEEQEYGLMNRTELPENYGMLFLMDREKDIKMWMKDTFVPLDMVFINKRGKVVYIKHDATPQSLEIIGAPRPSIAVLELPGGRAKAKNITVGDSVESTYFKK